MTENKEYQLQDVILGLRPEYLNLASQLRKLDQCLEVSDKISRYGFQTLKNDEEVELCCLFERKLGWFRHMLAVIATNYPDDGFHHFVGYAHKDDGEWQIRSEEEEAYRLVDKEQFDAVANAIFHNSFVQENHSNSIDLNDQKHVYCSLGRITISERSPLFINQGELTYYSVADRIEFLSLFIHQGELTYYSVADRIEFLPSASFGDVKAILNTSIPREVLTPYQQNLIDKYLESAKPVYVDENSTNSTSLFGIEEGPGVVLIKNLKSGTKKKSTVS